jgi:leucyl aminopeptidase
MFQVSNKSIFSSPADCAILFYQSTSDLKKFLSKQSVSESFNLLKSTKQISDSDYKEALVENQDKKGPSYFLFVHPDEKSFDSLRKAAGAAIRRCKSLEAKSLSIAVCDSKTTTKTIQDIVEGTVLGAYDFNTYKSDKKTSTVKSITLCVDTVTAALTKTAKEAEAVAKAQNIARDLTNLPPNDLSPKNFVDFAKKLFKSSPVEITVIDKKQAEKLGMNAFLAVARGSVEAPYLLEITLNKSSAKPVVLVGKGVTFDSGGLSLKPASSMMQMNGDMGGAAAVLAALHALVETGCKKHVIGLMPLVENMPSANAFRPTDIITAMNGKTIEIINTDAEGRLILADALCVAVQKKPKLIVDIATLTGAATVALGEAATAILGNSQTDIDKLLANQENTGERLWQLPLYEEYLEYLRSSVADIMNCVTNRQAGTSTAAKFLEQFVDNHNWIHLDIAPTMHATKTSGYTVKGMTGVATRTLIDCVNNS